MEKDLYKVLGVSKNATKDELKSQYRKLSKQYHPDLQAGKSDSQKKEAEEKFKDINAAYAVLSDDDKRRQYDQFGTVGNGPQFGGGGEGGFDPFSFFRSHFGGSPFGDDFGFGGFNSASRQPSRMDDPEDGSDVLAKMTISFADMVHGMVKDFDIGKTTPCVHCGGTGVEKGTTPSTCPKCKGQGRIVHTVRQGFMMSQTVSDCPDCHGTGVSMTLCSHCHGAKRDSSTQHISLKVPPGIKTGQKLRVAKAGECGVNGGRDGDLFVQVIVEDCPNRALERISDTDLMANYPIDSITATFGGDIEVQTIWGKKVAHVPANSCDGQHVKVIGGGLKLQNGQTGDLVLKLHIAPFTKMSNSQKDELLNLKRTMNKSNVYGLTGLENDIMMLMK